jgi:hypothetical protein
MQLIAGKAADLQVAFDKYRELQITKDGAVSIEHKHELRTRLRALEHDLTKYLLADYGVKTGDKEAIGKWVKLYQPFHWFIEFHKIMTEGGFDVIIGNPPYLERRQIEYEPRNYVSLDTGAVHALCIERSTQLLHPNGSMSMIVPLSLPSTQRMHIVQRLIETNRNVWYANYAWRPGKLFDTVNRALTIFVSAPASHKETFSTNYQKWTSADREQLFQRMHFVTLPPQRVAYWVPKLGNAIEKSILDRLQSVKTKVAYFSGASPHKIYYRTTGGLYWKVFTDFPPKFRLNGKAGMSSRETSFGVARREHVRPIIAVLSSDIFWWWYTVSSNLRDLNPSDIQNFPLTEAAICDPELSKLANRYIKDIEKNSSMLVREQKQTGRTETQSFKIQKSKAIIDLIDRTLARHYGFDEEQLDFIVNYDIEYRLGADHDEE